MPTYSVIQNEATGFNELSPALDDSQLGTLLGNFNLLGTAAKADATTLVPYSGAMQDVDLGANNLSVGTTVTVNDTANATATQATGTAFTANGNFFGFNLYAFKGGGANRVYSQGYYIDFTDDNSSNTYQIDLAWDAVSGVDGYVVLVFDPVNGYYGNYYLEIDGGSNTTLAYTGTGVVNGYLTIPHSSPASFGESEILRGMFGDVVDDGVSTLQVAGQTSTETLVIPTGAGNFATIAPLIDGSIPEGCLLVSSSDGNAAIIFGSICNDMLIGADIQTYSNANTHGRAGQIYIDCGYSDVAATIFRVGMGGGSGNTAMQINSATGSVLIGGNNGLPSDDGVSPLQVNGTAKASQFVLSSLNTAPASSTDTGTLGEVRICSDAIYVCIATDTWVKSALTTF